MAAAVLWNLESRWSE